MPKQFPVGTDPDTGELIMRLHYDVHDLAEMLDTTERTVYAKMRAGEWPYHRIVRAVYFSPDDLTEILAQGMHAAGTPGGLWNEQGRDALRRAVGDE